MSHSADVIKINRAPVLTLWAAVVAERLGFDRDTALTLGQAVAGLSAYAKGVSLGIIEPTPDLVRERGERLAEGEQLPSTCSAGPCPWCGRRTGCGRSARASPATRRRSRSTSPASSGRGSMTHGRRMGSWRLPMSRASYSGADSGCTSGSGRRCRGRVRLGCEWRAGPGEGASGPLAPSSVDQTQSHAIVRSIPPST